MGLTISGSFEIRIERDSPPGLRAILSVTIDGITIKGEGHMAYTLPNDKKVLVAVAYLDAHGHPVDLPQGNVEWETSDETIASVTEDASNDQQAEIIPGANLGNAQITCTGQNTDGTPVIATLDVTVVSGNAVSGTIQPVGEPVPQSKA